MFSALVPETALVPESQAHIDYGERYVNACRELCKCTRRLRSRHTHVSVPCSIHTNQRLVLRECHCCLRPPFPPAGICSRTAAVRPRRRLRRLKAAGYCVRVERCLRVIPFVRCPAPFHSDGMRPVTTPGRRLRLSFYRRHSLSLLCRARLARVSCSYATSEPTADDVTEGEGGGVI